MRPAQGEIKVAHLMIRATPGMPAADSATARKKVDELYNRLARRGENWEKLVGQFSEDAGSAANGGELPPFGTGRMIPSFEEVAFKLQKPGDISQPVQTPYGWHIIKLMEKQPVPSFEAMEPTLKSKVAKDSRSELNRTAFLKRVRTENNFTENQAGKEYAFAKADTALVAGRFQYTAPAATPAKGKKPTGDAQTLFTIGGKPYLVSDFLTYAQQNQKPRAGADARFAMQQLYDQYVDQSLTEYEKANLETKYEDYRMLVKEYRDGILLFQLMDEKVWSKAIEDTVGLQKFFTENQAKYQWEPRVQATVISAASPELLARAQQYQKAGRYQLKNGLPAPLPFRTNSAELPATVPALDDVAARLTSDPTLSVNVVGRVKRGETAALARRRADRVTAYLRGKGVTAERLRTTAESKPAAAQVAFELTTTNPAALEEMMNGQNPLAVQVQQRSFQKGDNKAVDQFLTSAPGTYTAQQDGRYYAIRVEKQLPAGPKTLAEARGQATSDYQNYLEKEWLNQLRAQYPVKVNQAEVDKLVTK
ncbi:peptidylprolyl isomerase [Hymenobacter sp. 5516J-16]|uniref:peptidylprolyl isomerase n=1 Tax=Hymenobacter sp. 5516J-16 TaxID=2932253 RepID=UPI003978B7B6